ncbi:MAG: hypothetical protein D6756_08590 [Cyanobacteria bacterium J083]|nr:MAG: hypothetical protein D6756_08590 [Cyanobacteria bacterium J083]
MSAEKKARALMMRHHHMIKNRQQSMFSRAAAEIGVDVDNNKYWTTIQGKPSHDSRESYDRSGAALS